MCPPQLVLPGFSDLLAHMARDSHARRRFRKISPRVLPIILQRVLSEEELAFTTYALMSVTAQYPWISMARLSAESGMSYHAVRNQLDRCHWFLRERQPWDPIRVRLTKEALAKLDDVRSRVIDIFQSSES